MSQRVEPSICFWIFRRNLLQWSEERCLLFYIWFVPTACSIGVRFVCLNKLHFVWFVLCYKPGVRTVYNGEHSLRNFGPVVWNVINVMLPEKFKKCSSLKEFKNAIKEWIPINCPCRICKNYVWQVGFVTSLKWRHKTS